MPISDPIITTSLSDTVRPAAEKLEAIRVGLVALRSELDSLAAFVTANFPGQTGEVIDDGRTLLPVTFDDVVVLRNFVNALAAVCDGVAPGTIPSSASVAEKLALIGVHSRVW